MIRATDKVRKKLHRFHVYQIVQLADQGKPGDAQTQNIFFVSFLLNKKNRIQPQNKKLFVQLNSDIGYFQLLEPKTPPS